jgi:hypothetical protein
MRFVDEDQVPSDARQAVSDVWLLGEVIAQKEGSTSWPHLTHGSRVEHFSELVAGDEQCRSALGVQHVEPSGLESSRTKDENPCNWSIAQKAANDGSHRGRLPRPYAGA